MVDTPSCPNPPPLFASGYDKQNWKDVKRLGYSSATLKIEVAAEAPLTGSALARARQGTSTIDLISSHRNLT